MISIRDKNEIWKKRKCKFFLKIYCIRVYKYFQLTFFKFFSFFFSSKCSGRKLYNFIEYACVIVFHLSIENDCFFCTKHFIFCYFFLSFVCFIYHSFLFHITKSFRHLIFKYFITSVFFNLSMQLIFQYSN